MSNKISVVLVNFVAIIYDFFQGNIGKFHAEFDVGRAYAQSVPLNSNETEMLNTTAELEKSFSI